MRGRGGERRKERESRGREHKKSGNTAFRSGQYSDAVEQYSHALKHTPWDVSLYTNRALVWAHTAHVIANVVPTSPRFSEWILPSLSQAYNRLGHHNEAIADCDAAIKVFR